MSTTTANSSPDTIDWSSLSTNPSAIHLLKPNPDKIRWSSLSRNPSAIDLLESNPAKISWDEIRLYQTPFHRIEYRKIAYYLLKSGYIPIYDDKYDGIISRFLQCYLKADKHYFYLSRTWVYPPRLGYLHSYAVKSRDRVLNDYCSDMINDVETTTDDRWTYEYLRTYFSHRAVVSQISTYFLDRELISEDI